MIMDCGTLRPATSLTLGDTRPLHLLIPTDTAFVLSLPSGHSSSPLPAPPGRLSACSPISLRKYCSTGKQLPPLAPQEQQAEELCELFLGVSAAVPPQTTYNIRLHGCRTMLDLIQPKLTFLDLPLFMALLADLFPGVEAPSETTVSCAPSLLFPVAASTSPLHPCSNIGMHGPLRIQGPLRQALEDELTANGLQVVPEFVGKMVQIFDCKVRIVSVA